MNTSGALDSEIDVAPRMLMRGAAPIVPDACSTFTPGTRPSSTSVTFVIGALEFTSFASMLATTAPCAARDWLPTVPVTTIASSSVALALRAKSTTSVPPSVSVTVFWPGV